MLLFQCRSDTQIFATLYLLLAFLACPSKILICFGRCFSSYFIDKSRNSILLQKACHNLSQIDVTKSSAISCVGIFLSNLYLSRLNQLSDQFSENWHFWHFWGVFFLWAYHLTASSAVPAATDRWGGGRHGTSENISRTLIWVTKIIILAHEL